MSTTSGEPGDERTLLVEIAEAQVAKLVNAAVLNSSQVRTLRRTVRGLIATVVLLLGMMGAGGYFIQQERSLAQSVQQGSISQCEAGNDLRASDTLKWDEFIGLILQGNHDASVLAKGRSYEAYVAQSDTPRNCNQVYNVGGRR